MQIGRPFCFGRQCGYHGRLIRTLVQKAEIPLEDAVRMASETPSKIMGVYDRKGSLQKGKDADILILDQDLNIVPYGQWASWSKELVHYNKSAFSYLKLFIVCLSE